MVALNLLQAGVWFDDVEDGNVCSRLAQYLRKCETQSSSSSGEHGGLSSERELWTPFSRRSTMIPIQLPPPCGEVQGRGARRRVLLFLVPGNLPQAWPRTAPQHLQSKDQGTGSEVTGLPPAKVKTLLSLSHDSSHGALPPVTKHELPQSICTEHLYNIAMAPDSDTFTCRWAALSLSNIASVFLPDILLPRDESDSIVHKLVAVSTTSGNEKATGWLREHKIENAADVKVYTSWEEMLESGDYDI
ncbi:hypothetical protein LTR28_001835, partial [Elasticomyces elasticus]